MKFFILSFFLFFLSLNDEKTHRYKIGEQVILWYSNFYPDDDHLETYRVADFPICLGKNIVAEETHTGFLHAIQGLSLDQSGILINFKVDTNKTSYCQKNYEKIDQVILSQSVRTKTKFEIFIDGLIALGSLSSYDSVNQEIYTHIRLLMHYNKDQIVKIQLEQDSLESYFQNSILTFTYEVLWKDSKIKFEDRYLEYKEASNKNYRIRLLALWNSIGMMVVVVVIAMWILIRTLKFDIIRYNKVSASSDDINMDDQYGWKLIYRDINRKPKHYDIILLLTGIGIHIFLTSISTAIISLLFHVVNEIPKIINFGLYMYATLSPVSSFISATLYQKFHGKKHFRHILSHIFSFPLVLLTITSFLSLEARIFKISRYLDFSSFVYLICGFFGIVVPFSFAGFLASRSFISNEISKDDISELPGSIPRRKWYLSFWPLIFITGFLPFGTVVVEMYFLLNSFWTTKITLVFEFTILILLVMLIISISVNLISVYTILNLEDYRWQWLSFCNGLTVGIYLILYTIVFQVKRTKVSGHFQLLFYYSYSILISISIGIICGSFNFISSSLFVERLFQSLKSD